MGRKETSKKETGRERRGKGKEGRRPNPHPIPPSATTLPAVIRACKQTRAASAKKMNSANEL